MNPIKIALLTLVAWIVVTIIVMFSVEDVSEKPFIVLVDFFYLSSAVCLISFLVSSLFYRQWVENHKRTFIILLLLLAIWVYVIYNTIWSKMGILDYSAYA